MNERVKFIAAWLEEEESFAELCERFGISRKQGYKWCARYEAGGVAGLVDRSRAPLTHPHAVSEEVSELIVTARKKHPQWGPRKLLVVLRRHHPDVQLPWVVLVEGAGAAPMATYWLPTTNLMPSGARTSRVTSRSTVSAVAR